MVQLWGVCFERGLPGFDPRQSHLVPLTLSEVSPEHALGVPSKEKKNKN